MLSFAGCVFLLFLKEQEKKKKIVAIRESFFPCKWSDFLFLRKFFTRNSSQKLLFEKVFNLLENSALDNWLGSGYTSGGFLEDRLSGTIGKLQDFCFHLYLRGTSPFTFSKKTYFSLPSSYFPASFPGNCFP